MNSCVCLACRWSGAPEVTKRIERLVVRGEPIDVEAQVAVCPSCGEDVFSEDLDEATLSRGFAEYRRRHHLLGPESIRAIRERYGLGQRAFSLLLGWGEITLHRYESGSVQDPAHDSQIRLAEQPENVLSLLAQHGSKLTPQQTAKVRAALTQLGVCGAQAEDHMRTGRVLARDSIDEFGGYRPFDPTKFKDMVLQFTQLPSMFRTKLNKMLFYADFLHFKENAVSISGSPYLALQRGPVPQHYDWLTAEMEENGELLVEEVGGENWGGEVLVARRQPSVSAFSVSESRALRCVAERFSAMTSTALSANSHTEAAYEKAVIGELISYHWAPELSVSCADEES